jgi:hypothetical protein
MVQLTSFSIEVKSRKAGEKLSRTINISKMPTISISESPIAATFE